jgi:hypothetical protein
MIAPSHSHTLPSGPALLALVGATAEWQVGIAPSCLATVRLLHEVDFTVRAGECVLVHHDEPAGVRVLMAALSGHPRVITGGVLRGSRVVTPGVRVRRGSIRRDLVAPIVAGWRAARAAVDARVPRSAPPPHIVHLLRASRGAYPTPGNAASRPASPVVAARSPGDDDAWRAWAFAQVRCGGALVIVADTRGDGIMGPQARQSPGPGPTAAHHGVHEMPPPYASHSRDVRECLLRNGRLLARASTVPQEGAIDQGCRPSEAPLVVGP